MRSLLMCAISLLLLAGCTRADAGKNERTKPSAPAASEGSEPGQRVPAFEIEGTRFAADGKTSTVKVASHRLARPTAFVFLGTTCGTTAKYLGRLAALEQAYAGKLDLVLVYPNKTDSLAAKQAFHQQHRLAGPLVDDQGGKIARLLGGQRTAELVLTGKDGVIVYRGAIDDSADEASVKRRHFAAAADEHLAGKPVSQPKTVGTA